MQKIDPYSFDKAIVYLRNSESDLDEALKEIGRE